jgi:hypothetical protein
MPFCCASCPVCSCYSLSEVCGETETTRDGNDSCHPFLGGSGQLQPLVSRSPLSTPNSGTNSAVVARNVSVFGGVLYQFLSFTQKQLQSQLFVPRSPFPRQPLFLLPLRTFLDQR